MAKKQLVLGFFVSEAAADEAVSKIKQWDKASKEVKLGAIGVLVKDDKGKIKTQKLGQKKTGTFAVLGALAGVLSGGVTVLGGAVVGGILGAFFHKGLGLSKDDLARIGKELDGGKAAVGILAHADEAAGDLPNSPSWAENRKHANIGRSAGPGSDSHRNHDRIKTINKLLVDRLLLVISKQCQSHE